MLIVRVKRLSLIRGILLIQCALHLNAGLIFTRTPTKTKAPSTNQTIEVADSGSLVLNDSATLNVFVNRANTPPILSPIADQVIQSGTKWSLTVNATDADANKLTFSLEKGAPSGMSINPGSNVITWTPKASQAPSTNLIAVLVTDDGAPRLSDSNSFQVIVCAVISIHSGDYTESVTNLAGLVVSAHARLTVNTPVTITQRPVKRTVASTPRASSACLKASMALGEEPSNADPVGLYGIRFTL